MKKDDALALILQKDYFNPTKLSFILDDTVKRLGAWLYFVPKYHQESISLRCVGYTPRGRLEPSLTMSGNPFW